MDENESNMTTLMCTRIESLHNNIHTQRTHYYSYKVDFYI